MTNAMTESDISPFLNYEDAVAVAIATLSSSVALSCDRNTVKLTVFEAYVPANKKLDTGTNWAKAIIVFTSATAGIHRVAVVSHAVDGGWSKWEHVLLKYSPFFRAQEGVITPTPKRLLAA